MKQNILITGLPKSGKSTLLRKTIQNYKHRIGFVTNEVRDNGTRVGFEIETYSGAKTMLASVNFKTKYKVSKYCVEINNLNTIITEVANFSSGDLLFLDEIGQMELFSKKFKWLVTRYLDSDNICIATLTKVYNDDFIEAVRQRSDVIIVEIAKKNLDTMQEFVENLIKKIIKAKKYVSQPERFTIKPDQALIRSEHGIRNLYRYKNKWLCDCDFFQENKICSHTIALEQFLKN